MITKQKRQAFIDENVYGDAGAFVAQIKATNPKTWENRQVIYNYEAACKKHSWEVKQHCDGFAIVNESQGKIYDPKEDWIEEFEDCKELYDDDYELWLATSDTCFRFKSESDITETHWKNLAEYDRMMPEHLEVYAYWEVSNMLAEHLEKEGELIFVIDGKNIWGQSGFKQDVADSYVLKNILENITRN